MAVHLASRIGALADGGEILASTETLADAGDVPTERSRTVPVKGVKLPVAVTTVNWR